MQKKFQASVPCKGNIPGVPNHKCLLSVTVPSRFRAGYLSLMSFVLNEIHSCLNLHLISQFCRHGHVCHQGYSQGAPKIDSICRCVNEHFTLLIEVILMFNILSLRQVIFIKTAAKCDGLWPSCCTAEHSSTSYFTGEVRGTPARTNCRCDNLIEEFAISYLSSVSHLLQE